MLKEDERYFIKIGNCYADFIGAFHDLKIRADHNKAYAFVSKDEAKRFINNYCGRSRNICEIVIMRLDKKEEEK